MTTNFIFILADDLGYADLGCYGGREQISPSLDRMAAQGLRMTQSYSNSPVCSPTRFALATGRYQYRLRGAAEEPLTGKFKGSTTVGLPPEQPTMASLLRGAGYRTALIGKWHLGYPPHFGPLLSGYETHFGPLSGGASYFTHLDRFGEVDLYANNEVCMRQGEYLTDLLSNKAIEYVQARGKDRDPFLLSLHYTAPHWPWESRHAPADPPVTGPTMEHLDGGSIHIYHQMIREMDEGIGRLLAALEEAGLSHDTLVIFTSDNGGERFSDNWPLVGGKMDLTEGGIRVPCVAHWPATIAPGALSDQPHLTMDWTATLLAAAKVQPDPASPLDGVSLLPVLDAPNALFPRPMFWRMKYRDQRAMRDGRWKYLKVEEHEYLFDLETDARERANKARQAPERLATMRSAWEAWNQDMAPIPVEATVSPICSLADMPTR
ncbi:MAG: sulfatase-like hydrolase/transferase [Pigmentiphaga sp.]|nr:sulfatase-like hydrolase/transferase [Pigmentiphaga sp.]